MMQPLNHHMSIPWIDLIENKNISVKEASLVEKSLIIGRIGILMLSCGTGAWRVREAMNKVARELEITCSADIALISIEYTCFDASKSYTQVLSLANTSVNTDKLNVLEKFVNGINHEFSNATIFQIHQEINKIEGLRRQYSPVILGLAAAIACSAFIFLLGGGFPEMICTFLGAGVGNYVRAIISKHNLTTILEVAISVSVSCMAYMFVFKVFEIFFYILPQHEAGYIGAMLFIIPGFPFITSILDISKLDIRSGLERLTYVGMIILVATLTGWLIASGAHFRPEDFVPIALSSSTIFFLRIPASFLGVFGFSIMFNSSKKMAVVSGIIGAIANPLRLELVDATNLPPAAAAFIGALVAGILATFFNRKNGYPRISLTVPSIVIMVPGLYIYRGIYNVGINNISTGASWLTRAGLILIFLPLGLFIARSLFDKDWRHFN